MFFWGKHYCSLQIIVRKTAEKLVILTVRINDLEEITHTHLPASTSALEEELKKEGGKEQFCTHIRNTYVN